VKTDTNSNYGRKRAFLKSYNARNRALEKTGEMQPQPKTAHVHGFDFPIGEKPWVKR
jgi:hypothetical protein